jgi:hypothetical protein
MIRSPFIKLLVTVCLIPTAAFPQAKAPYQLPESFHFDYEVVQVVTNKKNATDTSSMHYFYTKSGDYAGMNTGGGRNNRKNDFVIFTKTGDWVVIDDNKKTITIINMANMMKDFGNAAKEMKKDSLSTHAKSKYDPGQYQSVKTGNTKTISGYTSEEYKITDNKGHKISIWYAKVDFNTTLSYLFGMGGGNAGATGSYMNPAGANPMLRAVADPNALMTEMHSEESSDRKEIEIQTQSITKTSSSKSTVGYLVNNYSNMDLKEMMQAESKKNPH